MEVIQEVRTVFIFPNGMIAVTDQNGEQIPELQGESSPELLKKIKARVTTKTIWEK